MKTLKYIVLLTVMLVNVTPYIKDGKVEWQGNEAAAQNYVCESNWFQRLIGDHKCVNTQNQADWFWGATHDCIKQNTQCICSECHDLFTCNGSATKCSDCLEDPSNEDDPEDPEDESTDDPEDENTEPGSTTPPGGSAGTGESGSNGGSPSISDGIGISIDKNMGIFGSYIDSPSDNWCAFAITAKINTSNSFTDTGNASTIGSTSNAEIVIGYAKDYFKNVRQPPINNLTEMIDNNFDYDYLYTYFPRHNISVRDGVSNAENLINAMGKSGEGVLVATTFEGGHNILGYKLKKSSKLPNSKAKITFYDPANKLDWMYLNYDKPDRASFQTRMNTGEFLQNHILTKN